MWPFHALSHVCQRWRHILFAWPNHLDLRLACTSGTAASKALDVWPTLPISLRSILNRNAPGGDDIISALEHRNRISGIDLLSLTKRQLKRCATLMQEQFHSLKTLCLSCRAEVRDVPVITDTFLGGSAPRLQMIELCHIPFPTLPKLLLSANYLVRLSLEDITRAGYISPDVMATCLAMLTRLDSFNISFRSWRSFPNRITRHAPLTRAVLPVLTGFVFEGVSEYSEELMARIDAPSLCCLHLKFFHQPALEIPQVPHFIHRIQKFKPPIEAYVFFCCDAVSVFLFVSRDTSFFLQPQCTGIDRQLSSLEQIYTQCSSIFSRAVKLHISWGGGAQVYQSMSWLGCLRPFNSVQILHVSDGKEELLIHIARVLGELDGEGAVEVLPILHTLTFSRFHFIRREVVPLLKPFVDARRQSGHPVAVE